MPDMYAAPIAFAHRNEGDNTSDDYDKDDGVARVSGFSKKRDAEENPLVLGPGGWRGLLPEKDTFAALN